MFKNFWQKYSLVIVLSFIIAILGMLHVILGYAKTPSGFIYLGTGHYYLDYFYYLSPIAQGARGVVMAYSQATTEDPTLYPHLWPYIVIGFIGKFLLLSPIGSYWASILVIAFIFSFLIYLALDKLLKEEEFGLKIAAFLLCIFAAPIYYLTVTGSNIAVHPYGFWYSMNTFFRRFEPIPHHLLSSVFILLSLLLTNRLLEQIDRSSLRKVVLKALVVGLFLAGVVSFNSFNVIVPLLTISVVLAVYILLALWKKNVTKVGKLVTFSLISLGIAGIIGILIKSYYDNTVFASTFKNIEAALHQNPDLKTFIFSYGVLLFIAPLGIIAYFKKFDSLRLTFVLFFLFSNVLYFSDLDRLLGTHNGRFLSPINYVVLAGMAVLAIKRFKIKFLLFILLMIYFLPVNLQVFNEVLNDRNISSPISYLPEGLVKGFKYLDTQPDRGNALVTPSQFLGTVLPIYSARKTYVARQIVTPNYLDKNIRTSNFYTGAMSKEEALNFLQRHDLRYVVWTSIEGYDLRPLYNYDFLIESYKNKDIVIFKVK